MHLYVSQLFVQRGISSITFYFLTWPNSAEHEIFQLINVKMPTVVGILTFMSRRNGVLGLCSGKMQNFLIIST